MASTKHGDYAGLTHFQKFLVLLSWVIGLHGVAGLFGQSAPLEAAAQAPVSIHRAAEVLRGAPLRFEPNLGRSDSRVRFVTRAEGMTSFLTDSENVIVLSRHKSETAFEQAVVRMKFEGATVPRRFEGLDKAASVSNYFIGNDPSKWRSGVPNFSKVKAAGVYPGIDIVYYGNGRRLEYDFVVAPGADPGRIRLSFQGAEKLAIDADGNLLITTRLGDIIHQKPIAYQEMDGERQPVLAAYVIRNRTVGLVLGNWDRNRELIVDPTLDYSTYLGGGDSDIALAVAVPPAGSGASGDVYIAGYTASTDFPVGSAMQPAKLGTYDAFVTKLNTGSTGGASLVFSTYLGGSQWDWATGIAIAASGNVYVVGATQSTAFPTTTSAYRSANAGSYDLFVTKLAAGGGSLLYSTYLGGSGNDGSPGTSSHYPTSDSFINQAIAIEADRYAYVTSVTESANFPVTENAFLGVYGTNSDAFVSKLDTQRSGTSSLVYSSYLGGAGIDRGYGIAVGSPGIAYVSGSTSGSFPTKNGFQLLYGGGSNDAFIAKLDTNVAGLSSMVYSTYLGGANADRAIAIAVDSTGSAYVTGGTISPGLGTLGTFQPEYLGIVGSNDAFVAKVSQSGANAAVRDYFTYFGGGNGDFGMAIAVNEAFEVYVAGCTLSFSLPVKDPLFSYKGGYEPFVMKLNASASTLLFSTYLGGTYQDYARAIAVNSGGIYVAGWTRGGFPITPNAFQSGYRGSDEAFLSRISLTPLIPASIRVNAGNNQEARVNAEFTDLLEARVTDSGGNPVSGASVVFNAPTIGASAALSDPFTPGSPSFTATTDANGLARVRATANSIAGGPYPVSATVTGVAPITFNLTNTAGFSQKIEFVQHPVGTMAGVALAPVKVKLTDAFNNPIANANTTIAVAGGLAPITGTLTQRTGADGIAIFSGLIIEKAGTYQLVASDGRLNQTSNSFTIAPATQITIAVLDGSGQSAGAGAAYPAPLRAVVRDPFQNPIPGVSVTFTALPGGATVTFSGDPAVTTDASGIAVSPAMTASGVLGAFSVNAAVSGASQPAVFTLSIVAGSASRLAFGQQPSNAVAGAVIAPPVTVQLQDSFGNPVRTANILITLQLNPMAAGAATPPAIPPRNTNSEGVATFDSLTVNQVGQYQLAAASSGFTSAVSSSFTISAGAPATIAATAGTPQTATILMRFPQELQATVRDQFGNPVNNTAVTFAAPASEASATLSSVTANTDAAGQAKVVATANGKTGSYNVNATVGVLTPASFSLTNIAGAAGQVAFAQHPATTAAGAAINPPVSVRVTDTGGNPVSGAQVSLQLQGGSGTLSGTPTRTTGSDGQAFFNDLTVDKVGKYTLAASSGVASAQSNSFDVTPGAASTIAIAGGDGQSAPVGAAYAAPLKASVQDAFGNPIPNVPVTFAAPSGGASVTFGGPATVVTDGIGIATSPVMTANGTIGAVSVTASSAGAPSPATFLLTNVVGTARKLAYLRQPGNSAAGAVIAPPVTVQLLDNFNNPVPTAGIMVALELVPVNTRISRRTVIPAQPTNASGVATFASLTVEQAGSYTFMASAAGTASAASNPFVISAGAPATITATAGTPQQATILTPFDQQLQATVRDAFGNPVGNTVVTFNAPASGASAVLSAVTAATDAGGNALITATANGVAGGYAVNATAGTLAPAAFVLTNITGAAGRTSFAQQPMNTAAGAAITPAVSVLVTDAGGNPVSAVPVSLQLQGGTGTLSGTSTRTTGSNGQALFNDLSINKTGTYKLNATTESGSALSNAFEITPGGAITIAVAGGDGQSASVGSAFPSPLRASVQDAFGNPIVNVQVTFAAPLTGASVTFGGPAAVATDGNGIAFSPLMTANGTVGSVSVTAATPGAAAPATFVLTNVAGTANKLAFVQQPGDGMPGVALAPPVTVQLLDSFGNPVRTAGVDVSMQADLVAGRSRNARSIPPQKTDSNGIATFAALIINQAGRYTLAASAAGAGAASSNPFSINAVAGPGSTIAATGGTPQSTSILTPFGQALQATVQDGFGNPLAGQTVTFSVPAAGASAALSAVSSVTGADGRAAVTAAANGVAGCYAVGAVTAGIAGSAAYSLCNIAAAASQVAFLVQPGNTQAGVPIAPPVVVRVTDAGGNPVSGTTVTLSLPAVDVLTGTVTATTNASGDASFGDLRINKAGAYQLTAISSGISASSTPFQVTAATAALTISVHEGNGQIALAGATYGGPLKARVLDLFGNPLPGIAVTFTAPASGPSVTFAGASTVNTDSAGIAVSPLMTANATPGAVVVTASAPNAVSPVSFMLTNAAPSANRLAFQQQPADTPAGAIMTPPVTVQLLDSSGNPVRSAGVQVTLQPDIAARRASAFSANLTQPTDANGLAAFASLSGVRAGTYQLQANSPNLASATSTPFRIVGGTPASIVATGGAAQSAVVNTVFGAPLQATVTDSAGNPVVGVPVVFLAPASGPGGTFGGQSTVTVNTDAAGRASAIITANSAAGSYYVTASSASITGSASFDLTNLPLPIASIAFAQQPTGVNAGDAIAPPVTVQVRDSAGANIPVSGVPITISLATGTGGLSGTLVQFTDPTGLAVFTDLRLDHPGAKTLRANSPEAQAVSNSFQVSPGPPSGIFVLSGSPQSAIVTQPFASLLEAQVLDPGGNPAVGVSVTFSVPASGATGVFAGPATVTTDGNGVATSPRLVAGGQAGNFEVTATTPGVSSSASFALVNLSPPLPTGPIVLTPASLQFDSELGGPAPPAQAVILTSGTGSPLNWITTPSAPWLTALPVGGTTPGQIAVVVDPTGLAAGTYTGNILVSGPGFGSSSVQVTYTLSGKPVLQAAPSSLVFATLRNSMPPAARSIEVTSTGRSIQFLATIQVSAPSGGTWLNVGSSQGTTPATLAVSVNPAGLAKGVYDGSIILTPVESGLSPVSVPVTLIVGCEQGGCLSGPIVTSVVNAASFQPGGAQRAIMTIFGRDLSNGVYAAAGNPLPDRLGPTFVTVNQVRVPLFYVSPTQINFQMPSGMASMNAVVTVTNESAPSQRASQISNAYSSTLTPVDPGVFLSADSRAAALNGDLSVHTPATPIPAGGYVILFLTGEGAVSPAVPDGAAAPSSPLSVITAPVEVSIGGRVAQVTFRGVAPGFAGLAQINAIVPAGLTPGTQAVLVTIDGNSSNTGLITVR